MVGRDKELSIAHGALSIDGGCIAIDGEFLSGKSAVLSSLANPTPGIDPAGRSFTESSSIAGRAIQRYDLGTAAEIIEQIRNLDPDTEELTSLTQGIEYLERLSPLVRSILRIGSRLLGRTFSERPFGRG